MSITNTAVGRRNKMDLSDYLFQQWFYYGVGGAGFFLFAIREPTWLSVESLIVFVITVSAIIASLGCAFYVKSSRNKKTIIKNVIVGYGITAFCLYFEIFPVLTGMLGLLSLALMSFLIVVYAKYMITTDSRSGKVERVLVTLAHTGLALASGTLLLVCISYRIHAKLILYLR